MVHNPQHKKKKFTVTPEQIPFEGINRLKRRRGDKTPRSNVTGEDISVEGTLSKRTKSAQSAVELFSGQLERGEFKNPLEETSLKNQLRDAKKLVEERSGETPETFAAKRGFELGEEKGIQLTPQEQFDEDVKKGLILGAKVGLPLAGLIVTGGLLGLGVAAGRTAAARTAAKIGGRVTINRSLSAHKLNRLTGKLEPRGTFQFRDKIFIGRTTNSRVNEIFLNKGQRIRSDILAAARKFPRTQKSEAITKSFLLKAGIGIGAVTVLIKAIETYPFAGFIKEEAIQITGFGFNQAERNDDLIGMEEAIRVTEEILNSEDIIKEKVPIVNVLNQLDGYFAAVAVKLETDKRTLEKKRIELKGGN